MPLIDLLPKFAGQRVLVIGDVILDHYVRGTVTRISPEAPVPILKVEEDEWLPGGAANVARNITALGARAEMIGIVGDDDAGRKVHELLTEDKHLVVSLATEKSLPTILKTRCIANSQQMLRLDREVVRPPAAKTAEAVMKRIEKGMKNADAVILSDYGKGLLQPALIQQIIKAAAARKLRVMVDPKGHDYARYRGVTVLTPNQKEASDASKIIISDVTSLTKAAAVLHKQVGSEAVVITRGSNGVSVFPKRGKPVFIPAKAREVFDVTGAGDTFISVLTLSLCAGATIADAAALGNLAGGIVVGRHGVATVSPAELRTACEQDGAA